MMKAEFTFDDARFKAWVNNTGGPVAKELLRRGRKVQSVAIRECRVDTGRLRASHSLDIGNRGDGTPVVRVGTNVTYAIWVYEYELERGERPWILSALDAARS